MACRHSGRHVYVALVCVFDCATNDVHLGGE